jgi:hypothetical protein
MQAAFCKQLRSGATIETVSEMLGVDHNTVGHWMTRGRKEKRGKFADFLQAVTRARAAVVQRLLLRAQQRTRAKKDGGDGADPLPLLAVLDRRYSQQVRVQVTSELTSTLDRLEEEFADEPEILERILIAIAEEAGPGAVAHTSRAAPDEDAGGDQAMGASPSLAEAAGLPRAGG